MRKSFIPWDKTRNINHKPGFGLEEEDDDALVKGGGRRSISKFLSILHQYMYESMYKPEHEHHVIT